MVNHCFDTVSVTIHFCYLIWLSEGTCLLQIVPRMIAAFNPLKGRDVSWLHFAIQV